MTYTELKEKHGERILSLVVTDIVMQGLISIREHRRDKESPLGAAINSCFEDIDGGTWDEIRAAIKRSL